MYKYKYIYGISYCIVLLNLNIFSTKHYYSQIKKIKLILFTIKK